MRLIRPSLFVFTALVLLAIPAVMWFLNWRNADVTTYLWNQDARPHVIRVIDDWTGRLLETGRIEPGAVVVVYHGRPDEWWVNADTAGDTRQHDVRIEELGTGCELVDATRAGVNVGGAGWDVAGIFEDGSLGQADWPEGVAHDRVSALTPALDPCGDAAPVARGTIVNATRVAVALGHGLVVPGCSNLIVHAGDLPDGAAPEPSAPLGAVRIVIPSMDAQDERWPIEPRNVTIQADGISDSTGAIDPSEWGPCTGKPKAGATADQ